MIIPQYDSVRKYIREKDPHLKNKEIHYTNEINKKIIEGYEMIKQKYPDDFGELKGFKETILSLVCPFDLLSDISKANRSK